MSRSMISYEGVIRKHITIGKKVYSKSLNIAEEEGLTFPKYIRKLLVNDIKRREKAPEIPILNLTPMEIKSSLGTRKRAELIKIMHLIRNII